MIKQSSSWNRKTSLYPRETWNKFAPLWDQDIACSFVEPATTLQLRGTSDEFAASWNQQRACSVTEKSRIEFSDILTPSFWEKKKKNNKIYFQKL